MPSPIILRYHKYEDAKGGWLKVTTREIKLLKIQPLISDKSFKIGSFVYLDHDKDMHTFITAWEERVGCKFPLIEVHKAEKSYIREYSHYQGV